MDDLFIPTSFRKPTLAISKRAPDSASPQSAAALDAQQAENAADDEARDFGSFFNEAADVLRDLNLLAAALLQNVFPTNVAGTLDQEDLLAVALERFELYQEQPHLLDPYLEAMVDICIVALRKAVASPDIFKTSFESNLKLIHPLLAFHRLCRVLYMLTKVRGHKTVGKLIATQNLLKNINILLK
ncbi:hypothetical protein HK096_004551 [Nowakowskiella sp. JEL0078]|nr:hypothetical protein HK096_004551 [Nowakowskiella sp. JEL0078]